MYMGASKHLVRPISHKDKVHLEDHSNPGISTGNALIVTKKPVLAK
jgi:hypothetical protein